MFGSLRFVLATFVLFAHTVGTYPWAGAFAVVAFFALSGYLMTLIVQERYGFSRAGFYRFAVNRFLRIFPAYWFTLVISLVFIFLVGDAFTSKVVNNLMAIPTDIGSWIESLVLFGQWNLGAQPVPQAWALGVELVYYLSIALFIGRRREYALACFVLSVLVTAYLSIDDVKFADRYYSLIGGALPFTLGAVVYFYRDRVKGSAMLKGTLVVLAVGHVFVYNPTRVHLVDPFNVPLYLNVLLFGGAIWALSGVRATAWIEKIDDLLGRLSYPIYLNHYLLIAVVLWLRPGTARHGTEMFLIAGSATILWSYAAWWLVERPLVSVRHRVARRPANRRDEAQRQPGLRALAPITADIQKLTDLDTLVEHGQDAGRSL